ncbi:hypothetical protein [Niveibacterium sp. SC-1]|uniref:hypothetical protein n=1 Tax=Niveibacterium sp. SC-1 TaxID=3135646 RepID=UPI00311F95E4
MTRHPLAAWRRASPFLALLFSAAVQAAPAAWFADAATQCRVWNPFPAPGETVSWNGPCVDGKAHGEGTLGFASPGEHSEYRIVMVEGHMAGRFEAQFFDAAGKLTGQQIGFSRTESLLDENYAKRLGPDGKGFSIDYRVNRKLQGSYRENLSDNRERAAYLTPTGNDDVNQRQNAVYLARYNPDRQTWSGWPDAATRERDGLSAYVVVTGAPGAWVTHRCENDSYEACNRLFAEQLAANGYVDWPSARMARIDAAWQQIQTQAREQEKRRQEMAREAERRQREHEANLQKLNAEKLYTYASKLEQNQDFEGALDAHRALIERFPNHKFASLAVARIPVLQDKLDRRNADLAAQQASAERDTRAAADKAQREEQRQAQLKAEQERQQSAQAQILVQRQAAYDQCKARADECNRNCAVDGGAALVAGIAGLANPKSVNMDGLNQLNARAQNSCARCESMARTCEASKP